MTRTEAMFARLRAAGEGALGTFLMLGDPGIDRSLACIDALVEGGADFLEVGIPFSDPVADGPVIQAAASRALAAGVRTADAFAMIAAIRARHPSVPIGVLTYANIVAARGIDGFCSALANAGADNLLVADVPSLEAAPYATAARAAGLDLVMIAAANTPGSTLEKLAALGSGYTYCLARAGVTGADRTGEFAHGQLFERLAAVGAAPPLLGFGLSTPDHVSAAIRSGAAGAIVGSALVERVAQGAEPADLAAFVASLKAATR